MFSSSDDSDEELFLAENVYLKIMKARRDSVAPYVLKPSSATNQPARRDSVARKPSPPTNQPAKRPKRDSVSPCALNPSAPTNPPAKIDSVALKPSSATDQPAKRDRVAPCALNPSSPTNQPAEIDSVAPCTLNPSSPTNQPAKRDSVAPCALNPSSLYNPPAKRRHVLKPSSSPPTKQPGKRTGVNEINRGRSEFGEYHQLVSQLKMDPIRFAEYMRMELETFNYILAKVEGTIIKNWNNFHRQPICTEERLVVCLRYLATGASFKSLARGFRMGSSTVGSIVKEVVSALWESLQPVHMPMPTKEMYLQIASDIFTLWNFPNCLGVIDGKHVRISSTNTNGASIVLQGVADAKYRFTIVDVGGYGKQSVGDTFQLSELYDLLRKLDLEMPEPTFLPGTNVEAPFVFLGDEAYPLLPCLLKPYTRDRILSSDEEMYNKRLDKMSTLTECAFGILFYKWHLLSKSIETDIDRVEKIVKCICVLHNTIMDKEKMQHHLINSEEVPDEEKIEKLLGRPTNEAKRIRTVFTTYLANYSVI